VCGLWKEVPGFFARRFFRGFSLSAEASPELLGVGYIIGFRASAILVAGGLLSWTVLIPLVKFLGAGVPEPIFPGRVPIAEMDAWQIWGSYIRYIGAGAVAAGGVINLVRALPTIISSFRDSVKSLRAGRAGAGDADLALRTERDLPITLVAGGSAVLVVGLWVLLSVDVNPGHIWGNAVASLLIVLYGFFFVTVSSRVVGMIGSSNNPISGDTITTLMGTCLLFVLVGWTGHAWAAVALSIGAVVCIAAANAGATSQDLKTGFLVGATPRAQQIGLIIGVTASVLVIGVTLRTMNSAYHTIEKVEVQGVLVHKEDPRGENIDYRGKRYQIVYFDDESSGLPPGKYLFGDGGVIRWRYVDGIGGRTLAAPQARLMSLVIDGILNQKLPWALVLLGIFIGITMELCGVQALPFAVGVYLPMSTTTPVFLGGVMKLVADRLRRGGPVADEEASEGMLFSSGLIAGGALMGIGVAALILGSARSEGLANALEAVRGDGLRIEADGVTVDGQPMLRGQTIDVRSHWFEHDVLQPDGSTVKKRELLPARRIDGKWQPFESLRVAAEGATEVIDYDPEVRARTVEIRPVDTWDAPLTADNAGVGVGEAKLARWLVDEGATVAWGQTVAELTVKRGAPPVPVQARQGGRLRARTVAVGGTVKVHDAIGILELAEPPIGAGKPPPPTPRRRIVVEPRPGSDGAALAMFLLLCAILVWSALPHGGRSGAAAS
jgi:hypothetical protein